MPEFGDVTPEDVVTVGDEDVDWSRVEELKGQIDEIQEIENADERLEAAKSLAVALGGND